MSPDICIEAQRSYDERTKPPLHSGFVGRLLATLEKRIPIHKAVFTGTLNSAGIELFISNEIWIIKVKVTTTANILTHLDLIFFHDHFKYSFIPSWLASKPIFS